MELSSHQLALHMAQYLSDARRTTNRTDAYLPANKLQINFKKIKFANYLFFTQSSELLRFLINAIIFSLSHLEQKRGKNN